MSIKYIIDNAENSLGTQSIFGTVSVERLIIDNIQSTSGLTNYVVVDGDGNTFYQNGPSGGGATVSGTSYSVPMFNFNGDGLTSSVVYNYPDNYGRTASNGNSNPLPESITIGGTKIGASSNGPQTVGVIDNATSVNGLARYPQLSIIAGTSYPGGYTAGVASIATLVLDGVKNGRAALFYNYNDSIWGLSNTVSSGSNDFALFQSTRRIMTIFGGTNNVNFQNGGTHSNSGNFFTVVGTSSFTGGVLNIETGIKFSGLTAGTSTSTGQSIGVDNYGNIVVVNSGSGTSGTSGLSGTSGTSGNTGTSGTSGNSGTSGTSGNSGTSGTSGNTGTSGTSGNNGTSGTSGNNGTSGTSGNNGTSGTSGTSGNSGTSGTSGNTGTSGTSGNTGTSGTSGNNGTSGTSGNNGTSGTSGNSGTSGTSGNTGTSGTSGNNGTSGTSGNNGTSGTSGNSGTSGTSGNSGTSGTSGTSGNSGTSGTSGNNGTSGTSGNNGTSGTSGSSGSSGTSGTSGNSGTSGTSGNNGTSGTSGNNGTSGTSGNNGTSGTSGNNGTSGTSGNNGTSGTSGNNGTSGTSGNNGTSGTSGNNGTSGTSGNNGTSGTSGNNGTSGTSGSSGTSGTSGSSGTSGTSGSSGSSGTSGSSGSSGTSGTSGTSGSSGSSGTSGTSGSSGTSGTSGSSGSSGTSGTSGSSGSSGTSGTSGSSGTSGTSGSSGSSGTSGTSGSSGSSGTSGTSGSSGSSGTSAILQNSTKLYNDAGTSGQMAFDEDYLYLCTSTNFWKRIALVSYNYFAPSIQATDITYILGLNSITANWTVGDGDKTLLKISPTSSFTSPADGNTYNANTSYSNSEQVVYAGTGNSVTVTGISLSNVYYLRAYAYNDNGNMYNTTTDTGNPTNSVVPEFLIINSSSTRTVSSALIGVTNITLDYGSYPILNDVGYVMNHNFTADGSSVNLNFNFGGSGFFSRFRIYKNNAEVFNLDGYASGSMTAGGLTISPTDYIRIELA